MYAYICYRTFVWCLSFSQKAFSSTFTHCKSTNIGDHSIKVTSPDILIAKCQVLRKNPIVITTFNIFIKTTEIECDGMLNQENMHEFKTATPPDSETLN